jgi:hypothetical protein
MSGNGNVKSMLFVTDPSSSVALQFLKNFGCLFWGFIRRNFLQGRVVCAMPNPQPGGPVDYTYSASYPLTYLAWVTLPRAYTPTSIALGVIRVCLQQGGSL